MTNREIQDFIDKMNAKFEEDYIDVVIFGLYYTLDHVEIYEGIDPNNEEFQLILCDLMFNDEQNSHECQILVEPGNFDDFIKGVVSKNKQFIFNVTFLLNGVKTTNPLTVITNTYKMAIQMLESMKTEEWVSYVLDDVL